MIFNSKYGVVEPAQAVSSAVRFILDDRNRGTSGAAAMAKVLLHAYNHLDQELDITDLCILDDEQEAWAWSILKARVDGYEPHTLMSDEKRMNEIVQIYWVESDNEGFI